MKIKEMPEADRPRERLRRFGAGALSTAELLAILLRTGTRGSSALDLASKILDYLPEEILANGSYDELCQVEEIGPVRAVTLAAALELARRLKGARRPQRDLLHNQKAAGEYLMDRYAHERQEVLGVLLLDGRNRLVREHVPYRGTSNYAAVEPREIFGPALVGKAAKIILFHTHPSGDPAPSPEDEAFTAKMKDLGARLQLTVVDHIVVGTEGWYSFAERWKL
jgi:DNA repair protein RadC